MKFISSVNSNHWFEYWEENGVVMTRDWTLTPSEVSGVFATLEDVEYYYSYMGNYVKEGSRLKGFDPNDVQPELPLGNRKCHCSWEQVYREGCVCGGE